MLRFNNNSSNEVCRIFKSALLLIMLSSLLVGCSTTGLRFYSATRDKQGQDLQTKLKAASDAITAKIAIARENHKAMLAEQLATEDSLMTDLRLYLEESMASNDSIALTLKVKVDDEIQYLSDSITKKQFDAARSQDTLNLKNRKVFEYAYMDAGVSNSPPSCSDVVDDTTIDAYVAKMPVGNVSALKAGAKRQLAYCKTGKEKNVENVSVKGSIADTRKQLELATNALKTLETLTKSERDTVQKAQEEKEAKKTPTVSATKLKDAWATLLVAGDAFSMKFVSDKRKQQITDYFATLEATASGDTPPKDASDAAADTILIENFIADYKKAKADGKAASLVPLMMVKQFDANQANAAQRDIDSRKAEIKLLEAKLSIQAARLTAYMDANNFIDQIPKIKLKQPMRLLVSPQTSAAKDKFTPDELKMGMHAVLLYLTAETTMRASSAKLDYQRFALIHERSIAYSEANALQWQNLITTAANQLSAYGGSGVKPETVLSFINSVALVGTAVGVNK